MTYEIRKLREVFAIKKGRKPELHAAKKPGDVPYLVAKVMRGAQEPEWVRRDDPTAVHVTEDEAIIICDGSNSGEVFSGFSGALSSTMAKIEPKVPIDQTYLRRFLESNAELFAGTKTGTAIPHLDQDAMFNLEIPLPPLPEQKRIVRLLDEAFEEIAIAKANTEKNLQNARALFQSSLQSQFRQGPDESHGASASKNMKLLALADYCDDYRQDIVDGPFGSNLKREDYLSAGIPVLKIQNIKPMTVEVKKMDYVSVEKFRGLQRHSFRIGDIVMTKLGDPLGVSAVVEDIEQGVIVADLVRIRASKINTKFLCYQLNAPIVKKLINAMQKGTTRPRVTLSVVRSLPIYAPSAVEQLKVVSILDKMSSSTNELIEVYLRKFKDLDLLKAALLRETFSGGGKTA